MLTVMDSRESVFRYIDKANMKEKLNINSPKKLEESERKELICLKVENAYIKAEHDIIKKEESP